MRKVLLAGVATADDPSLFDLLVRTGQYFHGRAAYSQAAPLLRDALANCEKTLGPEHRDTGGSLNNLANVLRAHHPHVSCVSRQRSGSRLSRLFTAAALQDLHAARHHTRTKRARRRAISQHTATALAEPFIALAVEALAQTWPCQR